MADKTERDIKREQLDKLDDDVCNRGSYYFMTPCKTPLFDENTFVKQEVEDKELPCPELWKNDVPRVIWDGHSNVVGAFADSWRMVGEKLHRPEKGTNFKRNYVYTPFGSSVFIWGSCFITMFGQYASSIFPFIRQLENFYAAQDIDGFIPRQLGIYDGRSQFAHTDLSAVGGNIFAWTELEWYRYSGDKTRLKRIYPVLLAYHNWLREHRTWKDGTYMSSGWGCGMDNIPRYDTSKHSAEFHHGFISWVDVTLQQIFNAKCLNEIADAAGIARDEALANEIEHLTKIANEKMWNEETGHYHDLDQNGNHTSVKHIGGFWALLAGIASPERAARLIASLRNPDTFAAPCGTRSLAKDENGYEPNGGNYWRGGVWCITEWAVVSGLRTNGYFDEAHELAKRHVCAIAQIWKDTNTIWESYDPEIISFGKLYGSPVRDNFVGFSGVTPIAMLIRDVFGITITLNKIVWRVRLLERHGIENLTLPDGNQVSLICEARSSADEKPIINIKSSHPIEVVIQ